MGAGGLGSGVGQGWGGVGGANLASPASLFTSGMCARRSKLGSEAAPRRGSAPSGATSVCTGAEACARATY